MSHVQLLARNLGIPNVAVSPLITERLAAYDGTRVILAVSPAGSVQIIPDTGQLDALFAQKDPSTQSLIRPDMEKLDLSARGLFALTDLRATDSGRTVGPKAANLAELRHYYPKAVAEGLAIPFGIFRQQLEQPMDGTNRSVFDWMVAQYRELARMPEGSPEREKATEAFRAKLERRVENIDPRQDFERRLRAAMAQVFGSDGTYGVFVRSDTNVEDLSGFTGAGLNLTVPNVVGVDNVVKEVSRVWASPFTRRAFAWRQAHMDQPEHVYTSVLLLRSVPSDKSGVMVTQDIDTSEPGWLSVVVSEGVGGGVEGEAAESLRINTATGDVRLLAQATAPTRTVLDPEGGVAKVPVSDDDSVLKPNEIEQLINLARELHSRFPGITDAQGKPGPADIEFGFLGGRLRLFQIRPFLESRQARGSAYLTALDGGIKENLERVTVSMDAVPREEHTQ